MVVPFGALALIVLVSGCNRSSNPAGDTKSTAASAANASPAAAGESHAARGVIKAFGEGKKSVKIAHEDIPGYMKAMTMPFGVDSPSLLDGLAEGDAIDFSFVESSDGRLVIRTIKKR
jgi:Cu/Ag efflux protein CusF